MTTPPEHIHRPVVLHRFGGRDPAEKSNWCAVCGQRIVLLGDTWIIAGTGNGNVEEDA